MNRKVVTGETMKEQLADGISSRWEALASQRVRVLPDSSAFILTFSLLIITCTHSDWLIFSYFSYFPSCVNLSIALSAGPSRVEFHSKKPSDFFLLLGDGEGRGCILTTSRKTYAPVA